MKPANESLLLRFASGELDLQEESSFLARCEIEPELWREAVLATAEHRRLLGALSQWATAADVAAAEPPPAQPASQPAARPPRRHLLAALAAGLCLGIVGMRLAAWATGPQGPSEEAVLTAQRHEAATAAPAATSGPDGGIPASPLAAPAPLALHPAAGLDDAWHMEPIIPETESQLLRKHGFRVEQKPTVYIIDGGNGSRWAVPVRLATLQYVKP